MTTKRPKEAPGPVLAAVLARDTARLRTAISAGHDLNEKDRDGRTPLHHACIDNSQTMVELLLDTNASVAAQDVNGWTPLHFATRNYLPDITKLLLKAGATVDSVDAHGNTPLSNAVFESRGRGEVITLLLAAGADRHRKNNHGVSPHGLAQTISNFDVKRWLT